MLWHFPHQNVNKMHLQYNTSNISWTCIHTKIHHFLFTIISVHFRSSPDAFTLNNPKWLHKWYKIINIHLKCAELQQFSGKQIYHYSLQAPHISQQLRPVLNSNRQTTSRTCLEGLVFKPQRKKEKKNEEAWKMVFLLMTFLFNFTTK